MSKKKSASPPYEKQVTARELFSAPLSNAQLQELQRLADLPDADIDFSDAPEKQVSAGDVQRGRFYRTI